MNLSTGVITTVAGNGTHTATAAITARPPPPNWTAPAVSRGLRRGPLHRRLRQQPDPRGRPLHRRDHHRRRQSGTAATAAITARPGLPSSTTRNAARWMPPGTSTIAHCMNNYVRGDAQQRACYGVRGLHFDAQSQCCRRWRDLRQRFCLSSHGHAHRRRWRSGLQPEWRPPDAYLLVGTGIGRAGLTTAPSAAGTYTVVASFRAARTIWPPIRRGDVQDRQGYAYRHGQ